jgi:hypothetical protein
MKITAIVVLWLLIVGGGMFSLEAYKSTPGDQLPAPVLWPAKSKLSRVAGLKTLVMMSHPKCPCTRASLAELRELLSRYRGQLTVYVLFVRPDGMPFEWTQTDLWQTASHIKGARVLVDDNSVEANRFKGLTSGEVVLYDAAGKLEFNGGITDARGHIGDNLGVTRILALLQGQEADRGDSPVFGCPLHGEEEAMKGMKETRGE